MLQEQNGFVKVQRIVPGSPSWKQKELEAGDLILKVGQKEGPFKSIVNTRLTDAVRLIRGPKGTRVRLFIRKPNDDTKTITIVRDTVVVEESYIKNALLKSEKLKSNKLFGYILVPKFLPRFF